MYLDVYIAFLDGTKDPDGYPNLVQNPTPPTRRQSPFFRNGSQAFWELKHRIDAGMYEGWPIDWGAWGALVTKQQISEFIRDVGAGSAELLMFVARLDPEVKYALVASEI